MAALHHRPTGTSTAPAAPSKGDQTPLPSGSDEHDLLSTDSGFSLLDFLSLLDAHLELWSRGLRKGAAEIREKAEALVDTAGMAGIQRSVSSGYLIGLGQGRVYTNGDGEGGEERLLSARDRELIERKYREVRARMREQIGKMSKIWEEEKTIALRDKISFFCGVMNVLLCALLLGFRPTWIPLCYTIQVLFFLPIRFYTYKKKSYHYFLFDLCYAVNLLCLVYVWILPGNTYLFEACWGLSLGSLGTAIATWRNSLVFHSLDKVISLAIHILPPFVFITIRHFYPRPLAELHYPALKLLPHLQPLRTIAVCMTAYLIWQTLYYHFITLSRSEKILSGTRPTSFTYLMADRKRLIGRLASHLPPERRELAFMAGQAVYTLITLLPPVYVFYDSRRWAASYLGALFSVSVWNGANFYVEVVFGRRMEGELRRLRKELEAVGGGSEKGSEGWEGEEGKEEKEGIKDR